MLYLYTLHTLVWQCLALFVLTEDIYLQSLKLTIFIKNSRGQSFQLVVRQKPINKSLKPDINSCKGQLTTSFVPLQKDKVVSCFITVHQTELTSTVDNARGNIPSLLPCEYVRFNGDSNDCMTTRICMKIESDAGWETAALSKYSVPSYNFQALTSKPP